MTTPGRRAGPTYWVARADGLTDQVIALGDVRGPVGRLRVRGAGGGRQIAGELVQVTTDCMPRWRSPSTSRSRFWCLTLHAAAGVQIAELLNRLAIGDRDDV